MDFRKQKYHSSSSLSALALKRFRRNYIAMGGLIFIGLSILIAVLGYLVTPDDTPFANHQTLELSTLAPGTKVTMLRIDKAEQQPSTSILAKMLFGERKSYEEIPVQEVRYSADSIYVSPYGVKVWNNQQVVAYGFSQVVKTNEKLSKSALKKKVEEDYIIEKSYWFGTDRFGRDVLSQLVIGTRVSLSVGFISVLISILIGITLGAIAGFFRGWIDDLLIWFINVVWSIPTLLLVIAITFALGKGFWQVFIAIGLTMWVEVARIVRGQMISIREKDFVEAAKAMGFSHFRIIFKHILPNVMSPIIVISAANFASAILIEAGLSFLGIGVQPPMPSWGTMIKEHYGYILLDAAFLALIPGIAISLMVLAFMLVGNGLRDALDVKSTPSS